MQPVVVTGRHRPHEVSLLVFSALLGLAFVIGARAPGSIEQVLPGWLRWTWYLLLLVSGGIGTAGLLIRDVYASLILERAAMWGQAAGWGVYGLAIFALAGWQGLAAGGMCAAFTVASGWRLRQVIGEIKLVRSVSESGE